MEDKRGRWLKKWQSDRGRNFLLEVSRPGETEAKKVSLGRQRRRGAENQTTTGSFYLAPMLLRRTVLRSC